ncbi:MAG TPA: kelch repeat-containing protein, partial [Kofleriaceae bacterium]|nr:kelch repeat-containing protein [Kofleriaceae bacterium]
RILVVGGLSCTPEPCEAAVADVEIFDPVLGETRAVTSGAPIPGGIVDHTATVVSGGRVLIAGGRDDSGALRNDAWLFDPDVEALVPTRTLTHARARHTATALCDGTVLLVGGESEDGEPPPAERYNPASRAIP